MKVRALQKVFNFPYLKDESQRVARAYGATYTPEVFVFNMNRILRYRGRIDDNAHERARKQYNKVVLNPKLG